MTGSGAGWRKALERLDLLEADGYRFDRQKAEHWMDAWRGNAFRLHAFVDGFECAIRAGALRDPGAAVEKLLRHPPTGKKK